MIINNKLDRSFGKVGFGSGLILIVAGIVSVIATPFTSILILLGAFVAFSHSGVQIDTRKRRIRLYQNICGIYKTGKWVSIERYEGLTVSPYNRITQMRSFSNRVSTLEEHDYRVFILNKSIKPDFAIKRCKTNDEAMKEMDDLSLLLHLPVFSSTES